MKFKRLAVFAAGLVMAVPVAAEEVKQNGLQKFMLYRSFVQDAP